jgi:serine/threonine protein kinase
MRQCLNPDCLFPNPVIFNIVKSAVIGSAEYCAPEQSMGKPLFISDLYSLGVTYLHLLTGMSPFDLYSPMEGEWVWRDYLNKWESGK